MPIEFNAETHEYFLDGRKLISVTQLMRKHGLSPTYDGVPSEALKRKAEYGTLVHKEIEDWINTGEGGFTVEVAEFAEYVLRHRVGIVASETILHNDIVAGTADLILADGIIADIKTTATLHREAVSWQLSIYAALCGEPITRGQAYHFSADGTLTVVDIPLKPAAEVLRLFECERNGEIYRAFDALPVTSAQMAALAEAENLIKACEEQKKAAEAKAAELRAALMEAMEQNGVTQFETDSLKITYVAASERTSIDVAMLKEALPADEYERFCKRTKAKPYLRVSIKKEGEE